MSIDETLKSNIRADIENILPVTLKAEDIDSLVRCLEITIGHHYADLPPSEEKKEIKPSIEGEKQSIHPDYPDCAINKSEFNCGYDNPCINCSNYIPYVKP